MSQTISSAPSSINPLNAQYWRLNIAKLPNSYYFLQDVVLPGSTLPAANYPNPFITIPVPGDHLIYDELKITFKVDANLDNYFDLYTWLLLLGFPKNFQQYSDINSSGKYSDATLIILDANRNANRAMFFQNIWPTKISSTKFITTADGTVYITAECSFRFENFSLTAYNETQSNLQNAV